MNNSIARKERAVMILDYVEDHADRTFEEEPLNYLDLFVLTQLAYFDFPQICWNTPVPYAMEHAVHFIDAASSRHGDRIIRLSSSLDKQLRNRLIASKRYEAVILRSFISSFCEGDHQFAALSFMIDDVLLIAYRGTDESPTGWREALELCRDTPGTGQILASSFLRAQAEQTNGPIIVSGHSKGGTLAVFAAAQCAEDPILADRIAAVLSLDGPGLPHAMHERAGYQRIENRITTFIPKSSAIGTVGEHPAGSVVYVDAHKLPIEQHLIYNWKIEGTGIVPARQSVVGKAGEDALDLLVDKTDDEQKKRIINTMIDRAPRLPF